MKDINYSDLPKKIALVHEWFSPSSVGGAEQVVQKIDKILKSQGLKVDLSALVDAESCNYKSWLFGRDIQTSFIQKIPFGRNNVQNFLPLLPIAIEQLDFEDYELILSSSHLVAKGVLVSPHQLHISYVHTPVRYAWDQMNTYLRSSKLSKIGLEPFIRLQLHSLRKWDQLSAARVNKLIANSRFTALRISRYWRRDSTVIHPPVNVGQFSFNQNRGDFYLSLCRLVPNKRVDLVVKAFNSLGLPLIVVGDGPEKKNLKAIAKSNVKILGFQEQSVVKDLLERCRAYVYAGIEDFGIAPVEAMAAGAPVIAFRRGGVLDTVRCFSNCTKLPTGILFEHQKTTDLIDAVNWFEDRKIWNSIVPEDLNKWASQFNDEAFKIKFSKFLSLAWTNHKNSISKSFTEPFLIDDNPNSGQNMDRNNISI